MCLEKYRQNVKWYRLDKEDCFLPVFYSHLMETLFSGEKIKDVSCIDMLKGLQNIDEDYVLLNAQIVQDAFMVFGESKKKIYLVLDDFHNVKNNLAVADTVRYLAMNLPECFSIVVTSRTETGIIGAWDFTGRSRGVKILPLRTGAKDSDWYRGTADAIRQNIDFIQQNPADQVMSTKIGRASCRERV